MLTAELVEHILRSLPGKTVGLLGDLFLDRYLDLDPALDEPSVETGLTAYQVVGVRSYPGALGTVLNNLHALGVGRIVPVSVLGDDGEGYELRQALDRLPAVDPSHLHTVPGRRTPTYCKPMHGPRELNRLDTKNRTPTPRAVEDRLLGSLHAVWRACDALLVLDQVSEPDCGVVTARVREQLAELAATDPAKFVLADSRERVGLFRGVAVKPNLDECLAALWVTPPERFDRADRAFAPLELARLVGGPVFCTAGAAGVRYAPRSDSGSVATDVPGYPVRGPVDVCGAGDSCGAGIACGVLAGATHPQAAAFGNLVASVTVQQLGTTGTASPAQVRARWAEVSGQTGERPGERPV